MSSGVSVKPKYGTVYFKNIHVRTMGELDNKIEEAEESVAKCKEKLKMLAAATPKDIFPPSEDNNGDCLFSVNREFDETWEWLEEEQFQLNRLYLMRDILTDWEFDLSEDNSEQTLDLRKYEDFQKVCPDPYKN